MNFYNENDRHAAAWLRELISAGHIAPGIVDERSITDIDPKELHAYTQCHFFAGIGGWSLALRLADWPDDRPVWTGSCPCQPFSGAGKGKVDKDERHLWPAFRGHIAECGPSICFGEQVASADGRIWLAGVRADLEGMGYGVGAADLCAAGVSAPHPRQRLYWMANARRTSDQFNGKPRNPSCTSGETEGKEEKRKWSGVASSNRGKVGGLEHAESNGRQQWRPESIRGSLAIGREPCGVGNANGAGRHEGQQGGEAARHGDSAESTSGAVRLDDAEMSERGRPDGTGIEGRRVTKTGGSSFVGGMAESALPEEARLGQQQEHISRQTTWDDYEIVWCRDPKGGAPIPRRVESGTFSLAHGVSGRVGLLRGYGNAIVPQVAAQFIRASIEALEEIAPKKTQRFGLTG